MSSNDETYLYILSVNERAALEAYITSPPRIPHNVEMDVPNSTYARQCDYCGGGVTEAYFMNYGHEHNYCMSCLDAQFSEEQIQELEQEPVAEGECGLRRWEQINGEWTVAEVQHISH